MAGLQPLAVLCNTVLSRESAAFLSGDDVADLPA